jgi:hypothetical protein
MLLFATKMVTVKLLPFDNKSEIAVAKCSSRNLPYPKVIDPGALPLRPERHVPNSIATMRRRTSRGIGD